ncbi:dCMP deaminase [Sporothrix brasiliensis 5110]|uniref:Deoxycytidylate deaminase n=1 Tax=Sporothrix brasiliensis 5110 TaxID=1398154 RepID=A0A0C2IBP8_9PEZI|nr:dCMP deaminase [Sporothrix brasiliensis 5110]KIH86696.1 dCMP deaminase [Sporothrix brasiliensis 5110]
MLIGICGSICAGKSTVAQYLVERHGFTRLSIRANAGGDTGPDVASSSSPGSQTTFATAEELLDFVTLRWRGRWVTTDVASEPVLDIFGRRPFFLLISVDAPVAVRWRRAQRRTKSQEPMDLETFVTESDFQLYGGGPKAYAPLLPIMARAAMRFANGGLEEKTLSTEPLFAALDKAGLDVEGVEQLLRPSWDRYFMSLASLAAQRSNCMKRRVGCVLVREKRVVSTGYNGTPRGLRNCGEGGCGRCNGGLGAGVALATCLCLHAEENALLEAGRERIPTASLANTILYCDTCPCLTCSIKIVQVGIGEVVYSQGYSMDAETAAVFEEAGVRLRQYIPPKQGLIHLDRMTVS